MGEQDRQDIRERLWQWRRAHPQATFDEIDAEVGRQYAAEDAVMVATLSAGGGHRSRGGGVGAVSAAPDAAAAAGAADAPDAESAEERRAPDP